MLTKTGLHAIRAMTLLGRLAEGEYVGTPVIAKSIGAPPNYLGKLLQALARAGLVTSQKGAGGGFRLARPAESIRLLDIVEPIEHVSRWTNRGTDWSQCPEADPLFMNDRWNRIRDDYVHMLQSTSVADLITEGEPVPAAANSSERYTMP
ncbi:MAG: Rrf2 family transcriptional regulator [Gemmataceae bacterium]|nr:Rrf2 family transcriptional regulator [Gemmataceae bacterium]